jgi:thiamine biosynthesis lipoprotein ApbE
MKTKATLAFAAAITIGVALNWMWRSDSAPHLYVSHFEDVMGTSLETRFQAASEKASREAEAQVLDEIDRQSRILSGYDPQSEFSRWARSAGVPTRVSPELLEVLTAFDDWRTRTGGALDPAAEAVSRVWKQAASEQRRPSSDELQRALTQVRERHWILDPATSTATRTSDVPLVLNSFTKSYIVDRAARRALTVAGVTGVIVNSGGDVVVRGDWRPIVGVADPVANADNAPPLAALRVRDAVIATSGGYKRGFDIGGQHYSHIIDPRTAKPAGHVLSATVVSASAIEAGALATAFCVLTPAESQALASRLPGVEYSLLLKDGRHIESAGWRSLQAPLSAPNVDVVPTLYAAEQAGGGSAGLLTVSLELARQAGMARRPYVAVWVEDKDRFPVRTVALWYDGKARYLPELRAWYRADRLRSMAEGSQIVDTVTSATRSAGKYTLQWDGKDNAGKAVAAGAYTIYIEAAREHGTYQMIRQDIDLAGGAKHIDLAGGTEISGASLDVKPAAGR